MGEIRVGVEPEDDVEVVCEVESTESSWPCL